MEKKHYFNFPAFRKALYDAELSERAKVIYMHLLQKSSAKGSNEVELTKPQIANDLGILTKNRDALAPKNVQRALGELEAHGLRRTYGEAVNIGIVRKIAHRERHIRAPGRRTALVLDHG